MFHGLELQAKCWKLFLQGLRLIKELKGFIPVLLEFIQAVCHMLATVALLGLHMAL